MYGKRILKLVLMFVFIPAYLLLLFIYSSATHRTFGRAQWQQLRDRLEAWRFNLGQVRESLDSITPAS